MTPHILYTLANDSSIDTFLAFLGGLKRSRSRVRLRVIPYDDKLTELHRLLRDVPGAETISDPRLAELDDLGLSLCPDRRVAKYFRKFACFGPDDVPFCYLDTDIVPGETPVGWLELFAQQSSRDIIMSDDSIEYVFRPGSLRNTFLATGRPACNAGFFIARRNRVTMENIRKAVSEAQGCKDEFIAEYGDQSFLNYLMWKSGTRVGLPSALAPRYADVTWAAQPVKYNGEHFVKIGAKETEGSVVPFLHWAGLRRDPDMPNWHIYLQAIAANSPLNRFVIIAVWRFFKSNPRSFLRRVPRHALASAVRSFLWRNRPVRLAGDHAR